MAEFNVAYEELQVTLSNPVYKGVGISTIVEYYGLSTSSSVEPESWSTSVPTITVTNKYLWNYSVITYTDGSTLTNAKRVIGAYGDSYVITDADYQAIANKVDDRIDAKREQALKDLDSKEDSLETDLSTKEESLEGDLNDLSESLEKSFNNNASAKTETFNSNASSKTTDFNTVVENANKVIDTKVSNASKSESNAKTSEENALKYENETKAVRDSIPSDYSALSNKVAQHTTEIEELQKTTLFIDSDGYICLEEE